MTIGPKTLELIEILADGVGDIEAAISNLDTESICKSIDAQTVAIECASASISRAILTLCDVINGREQ